MGEKTYIAHRTQKTKAGLTGSVLPVRQCTRYSKISISKLLVQ